MTGVWRDVSCDRVRSGLCDTTLVTVPPITTGQPTNEPCTAELQLTPDGLTWSEANQYCQQNYGTQLVTITSLEDNQAVTQFCEVL